MTGDAVMMAERLPFDHRLPRLVVVLSTSRMTEGTSMATVLDCGRRRQVPCAWLSPLAWELGEATC